MTREELLHDFGPKRVALRNTVFELTEGRFWVWFGHDMPIGAP